LSYGALIVAARTTLSNFGALNDKAATSKV
jgi:hypothetical protein